MTARRLLRTLPMLGLALGLAGSGSALAAPATVKGAKKARDDEETILREARKIERSMVNLVGKIRESTVAVVRYVEKDEGGRKVETQAGVGSGVVVDRGGKIFTNVHVIKNASRVEVIFSDGEVCAAEIFNQMPFYDFALLKVRRGRLKPAEWAATAGVETGQWSIAAGNPRALAMDGQPIVTLGIVSGKGRVAGGKYKYHNSIQTDAEINPGNSGGPLFDLNGRIIGINGLINTLDASKANVGVGYSIPAAQVQAFLPALISGDPVEPGYHGLVVDSQTAEGGGVIVKSVRRGSPADKVGLRAGDRIVGIGSNPIDNPKDWANIQAMLPNGRTISIRYARNNRFSTKKLTLQRPDKEKR